MPSGFQFGFDDEDEEDDPFSAFLVSQMRAPSLEQQQAEVIIRKILEITSSSDFFKPCERLASFDVILNVVRKSPFSA